LSGHQVDRVAEEGGTSFETSRARSLASPWMKLTSRTTQPPRATSFASKEGSTPVTLAGRPSRSNSFRINSVTAPVPEATSTPWTRSPLERSLSSRPIAIRTSDALISS
jgi:hypothetical protein